ncbi:unnamed protein product, partial [Timema podura]|nr:unnamed protein product [Timema podura]
LGIIQTVRHIIELLLSRHSRRRARICACRSSLVFSLGEAHSEADTKPWSLSSVGFYSSRDVYVVWRLRQDEPNGGRTECVHTINANVDLGYRDDSLETVKQNRDEYDMPLKILSYEELYGWTMDAIVKQIGRKNNCTFCGVFRRQALDRGVMMLDVDCLATGHNADDIAETVLMNILRGDIARLQRCTAIVTASEGTIPRCKPLKYTYEKEIVMYAYFKKLTYFSTECVFAPNAYRGHARAFLKDLEKIRPTSIIDIIHSGTCTSHFLINVFVYVGNISNLGVVDPNGVLQMACLYID